MNSSSKEAWENLGRETRPNWYLDSLVARAKKHEHTRLIDRWLKGITPSKILKTGLFEEAFGEDQLLFDLPRDAEKFGIDLAFSAVRFAKAKGAGSTFHFGAADLRSLPFKAGSFDLIISTSSLDHFSSRPEFDAAIRQIIQALVPGGSLILTLDNLWNPLYFPLKWLSRSSWAPYPLGYTPGLFRLKKILAKNEMNVLATDCLVHNPRLISTALFLSLRRILGNRSTPWIKRALKVFSCLDSLPTRYITACFVAVLAQKPQNAKRTSAWESESRQSS